MGYWFEVLCGLLGAILVALGSWFDSLTLLILGFGLSVTEVLLWWMRRKRRKDRERVQP